MADVRSPRRQVSRVPPRSAPASSSSPGCLVERRDGVIASAPATSSSHALRPSVIFSTETLHITVGGCAAFYAAQLSCPPEHPVTLSPSNLPTSLRVAPSLQVFTRENWSTPQFFRVAAVGGAAFDDSVTGSGGSSGSGGSTGSASGSAVGRQDAPRGFLQIIEHVSSSMDPRFHGHRLLFLPATIVVHVSPRHGAYVFASGRALGWAKQLGKVSASAAHHAFRQVDVDAASASGGYGYGSGSGNPRGSVLSIGVARSSVVVGNAGNAAAIAAVDAANSAVTRRLTSARRTGSLVTTTAPGTMDVADSSGALPFQDTALQPVHGQSFVKVACRKNQTVLLQRHGGVVSLGKRDVAPASDTASSSSYHASDTASDAALSKMLTDVDCGDDHVVATTEHGYLLTWGDTRDGRLGHGSSDVVSGSSGTVAVPRLLRALLHKRIVQVACGARHTLALAEDSDVFAWGYGKSGALGLATSAQSKAAAESVPTPMEVLTLKHKGVAKLACGDLHSAVVLTSGALLTCGWAEHGRLGRVLAETSSSSSSSSSPGDAFSSCFAPVDLKGRQCTFVACGGAHTLALTACGGVWAFGSNASGQLGVGDCRARWTPTRIAYFDESDTGERDALVVTSVAAGKLQSFATTQDARVFAWGSDEFGQCGVGAFPQLYTVPHLVASAVGLGVTQVACGDCHAVLLAHTSPRQLDALETHHPARYAQLLDKYERFVAEDTQRRSKVLLAAKQREHAHDAALRQRRPPLDPTLPRGPMWQRELQHANAAAKELVAHASPSPPLARRPQTATASLASVLARAKTRPSTSGARSGGRARTATLSLAAPPDEGKPKVRCSSATLWRQTRLFTFQAAAPPSSPPNQTELTSPTRRSAERPSSSKLRLSTQARQTLGRIFHEGVEVDNGTNSAVGLGRASIEQAKTDELRVAAAEFPATRPKSAPSRAMIRATTRAS